MRIQSQTPLAHHPGLDAIVHLYDANAKRFYPMYTRSDSTNSSFKRIGTDGTFPALSAVSEGGSHPYIDYRTPFYKDITPVKYGGIFAVSSEATETDKNDIIARKTTKLLYAADLITEQLCADYHNLATSTSLATPDGVAPFSTSHLYNGGTFSNRVTSDPALSVTTLETAINELMYVQKDDEGNPMPFSGPYKLVVHPAQAGLANRLVSAMKMPTTNNNDPNWAGSFVDGVVACPFFSSTTNWSLLSTGNKNPFRLLMRRAVKVATKEDFDKDGMKYRVNKIFTRYFEDARGAIFSAA